METEKIQIMYLDGYSNKYRIALPNIFLDFFEYQCINCSKDTLVAGLRSSGVIGSLNQESAESILKSGTPIFNELFLETSYEHAIETYHYWITKLPVNTETWISNQMIEAQQDSEKVSILKFAQSSKNGHYFLANHCPFCNHVNEDEFIHENKSHSIDYAERIFSILSLQNSILLKSNTKIKTKAS